MLCHIFYITYVKIERTEYVAESTLEAIQTDKATRDHWKAKTLSDSGRNTEVGGTSGQTFFLFQIQGEQ